MDSTPVFTPLTSPLLRLPAELRNRIYTYTLTRSPPLRLAFTTVSKTNEWISPPLCRTSRQLRYETLSLYYSSHTFVYDLQCPLDQGIQPLIRILEALRAHTQVPSLTEGDTGAEAAAEAAAAASSSSSAGGSMEDVRLGNLLFKHVNAGIRSMDELVKWVEMFVRFRAQLPAKVGMVYWPLKNSTYAREAAKGLLDLGNEFAKTVADVDCCRCGEDGSKIGDVKELVQLKNRIREFLDDEAIRKTLIESLRSSRGYVGRDAGNALGWRDEM